MAENVVNIDNSGVKMEEEYEVKASAAQNRVSYIGAFLYLFSIYASLLWFWFDESTFDESTSDKSIYVFLIPLAVGIINFVLLIAYRKRIERTALLSCSVLIKYGLIPFYFVCSLVWYGISGVVALIPVGGMAIAPFLVLAGQIFGWIVLLFGSIFSIHYLLHAKKDGTIPPILATVGIILSLFFFADVIVVMIACFKEKMWRKVTVAAIILFILAVIAVVVGVVWYLVS